MRRIAIYGGSFDPPTVGHLAVIRHLAETHDEVWVIPAQAHALKTGLSPVDRRSAMLRAALAEAGVAGARVVNRPEVYTVDMLEALHKERPGVAWSMAVGEDILGETHKWRRWGDIQKLARVVVMPRPEGGVSSSQVRARLAAGERVTGLVPPAVEVMLHAERAAPAAQRPPGGGWASVGERGGFRRRGGRGWEYWYPDLHKSAAGLLRAAR